jgi:hypothetical protein
MLITSLGLAYSWLFGLGLIADNYPRNVHIILAFVPPKLTQCCIAIVLASVAERLPNAAAMIHPYPFGCRAFAIAP